jgi:hypothetical protein
MERSPQTFANHAMEENKNYWDVKLGHKFDSFKD